MVVPTFSEAPTSSSWWSTNSSRVSSILSSGGTSNLFTFKTFPDLGDCAFDWFDEHPGVLAVALGLFGEECVTSTTVVEGNAADCAGFGVTGTGRPSDD